MTNRRNFLGASGAAAAGIMIGLKHGPAPLSVVCVGAHPGDPEFGCGGTLAKLSDLGHRVTIIYLTRGEAYDQKKTHEESASLRTAEAMTSCKILGATPLFAGQIDGNSEFTTSAADSLTKHIQELKPDIVFTHWPLDTHRDHLMSAVLTINAWVKGGQSFNLYFYEVNTGDETMSFFPTVYEDITQHRPRKKNALMAHRSQQPEQVYERFFKTMEDFRGLESGVDAAEGFIQFKPKSNRAAFLKS